MRKAVIGELMRKAVIGEAFRVVEVKKSVIGRDVMLDVKKNPSHWSGFRVVCVVVCVVVLLLPHQPLVGAELTCELVTGGLVLYGAEIGTVVLTGEAAPDTELELRRGGCSPLDSRL